MVETYHTFKDRAEHVTTQSKKDILVYLYRPRKAGLLRHYLRDCRDFKEQ